MPAVSISVSEPAAFSAIGLGLLSAGLAATPEV